jgi:hypothetical protein
MGSVYINAFSQFGPQRVVGTDAELPVAVAVADIDGDGFPDVVSGARSTNGVSWYKNLDGQGNFGLLNLVNLLEEVKSVSTADIDGDGDLDVLATASFLRLIVWYENLNGQGSFGGRRVIDFNAEGAFDAIAADMDGDGDEDVIGAVSMQNSAFLYENKDGHGNFYPKQLISSNLPACRSVFAADIDNDGDLDVVANSAGLVTISWFENLDGQGNFGAQNIVNHPQQPTYVSDVYCADIDGDGDLDIIGTANGENTVLWHENLDGLGTFGLQRVVTNEALECTSIFCADLDNDGDVDVLYGSTESPIVENSEIAWSENLDGLGNFGPKQVIGNTLKLTRAVYAADIDGDTDMDVFAASQNNDKVVWYENLTILGVGENSLTHIKVYPNPAGNKIFIDSGTVSIERIAVYDILGKQLFSKHENVKELDISEFQQGIYFLRIANRSGEIVKKILKN